MCTSAAQISRSNCSVRISEDEGVADAVLFAEPAVPRTRPLGRVEPAVHWFTESTRDEARTSRRVVNGWYDEMDDPDGAFAKRLRSEVDVDHHQALDELYVHHLLRQRYDDVRYEEGGTGPDFRVYVDGRCVAAVEVLSLFQRDDWTKEQMQHARLADELDRRLRPSAGYFVDFTLDRADREPPPRRFADWVARQIAELPPPENLNLAPGATRADLPLAVFTAGGCRITTHFFPMRPDAPARTDPDARIVGMGAAIGGMVNSGARLKDRLVAKAGGRYDVDGIPFLVAVGIHDGFCSDDQVFDGLYGGEAVVVATGQGVRRPDGFFGLDPQRGGRNTRVSAVAVISGLNGWAPANIDTAVYENPYPARAWPAETLPSTRRFGPIDRGATEATFGWIGSDRHD
jgi:hypothetical protein